MSGREAGPVGLEIDEGDGDIDVHKDYEGDTAEDKVIIVQKIVVVSKLCKVDEEEANDKPEEDEDIARHCHC